MNGRAPTRMKNAHFFRLPFMINVQHKVILREPFELHWHEFFELTFIYQGQGLDIINGVAHQTGRGVLQLLSPSDFHEIRPGQEGLELANIQFTREMAADTILESLFGSPGPVIIRLEEQEPALQRVLFHLDGLKEEVLSARVNREHAMRAQLELLMIELSRRVQAPSPAWGAGRTGTKGPPWLNKVMVFLEHHYRDEIGLREAAAYAGVSPSYFSHAFHKATGIPFQRYILELRLHFAHSLLRASDVPVTEACHAAGFNTLTYFEKMFKQIYGCTPGQVKRRKGKDPEGMS